MTLAEVQDGKLSRDQKWWRYLFLKSRLTEFCIVFSASICIAFKLIGPQILGANWSIIDNWDYFNWLGPDLNLPLSEVWHTLMTKTEVGSGVGRYRPSYYTLMVLETSLWGPNVHLWYLARTLEFGLFIASIWWIVSRFVGMWLSAVLLLPILAQPFWGDVWARLGPQEIYGCASVGLILFGAYGLFAGQSRGLRITGACVIALAGVILIGTKETFLPIAGLSIGLLFAAGSLRTIPRTLALCLIAIISAAGLAEFYIVQKIVLAAGADYNGNSIDLPLLISVGSEAFVHAIRIWGSVYLTVGLGCMFVFATPRQGLAAMEAGLSRCRSRVRVSRLPIRYAMRGIPNRGADGHAIRLPENVIRSPQLLLISLLRRASDRSLLFDTRRELSFAERRRRARAGLCSYSEFRTIAQRSSKKHSRHDRILQ
ncbi:hypothetical protein ABIF69_009054 [Bradyrhizobium japonicum]